MQGAWERLDKGCEWLDTGCEWLDAGWEGLDTGCRRGNGPVLST